MDPQFLRKYTKQFIDKNGNTLLHKAVKERDFILLYKAALMESSVNKQNKDGYSALHYSVKHGDIALVESALECGVNPLLKTKLGETAKDIALRMKNEEIFNLLDVYGLGLEWSILNKDTSSTIALLNNWVNLNNVAKSAALTDHSVLFKENMRAMSLEYYQQQNQFIHHIAADNFEEISHMLNTQNKKGELNINLIHKSNGSTPLSLAIQNSNIKMVNLLLDFGANPKIRLSDGTPLTHYCWNIKAPFQIILSLLKDEMTWHMRSQVEGLTILFTLATDNSITGVHVHKLLEVTECGILRDRDLEGRDFLEFCLLHNRRDLLDSMYESIVELFSKSKGKLKLISLAVAMLGNTVLVVPEYTFKSVYDEEKSEAVIQIYAKFMENVSTLELKSKKLFTSVIQGDLASVKQHNVADFINKNGRTALHEAILYDKYDIVVWLLAERPSLRMLSDLNNKYPLHYAYEFKEKYGKRYVHLLLENDENEDLENLTDMYNNTPSVLGRTLKQEF